MDTHSPNVKIIRSVSPAPAGWNGLYSPYTSGADNAIAWPVDPYGLLTLYAASAEHGRCIHVRAAAGFGNGFGGEAAKAAERYCPTGSGLLFHELAIDYFCFGNAFMYAGPLGWERRPALTMSRVVGGGFAQSIYDPGGNNSTVYYQPQEIIHFRTPCPGGGFYSLPDWIGGAGMVDLVKSATDFNREFFANHALPQYAIVTYGARLSPDEELAVKNFFNSNYRGAGNQHKTLYLHCDDPQQGKIQFEKLTDNKEGDFLRLLDAARDRIVIAHGTPPRMVGIVSAGSLGGASEVTGQLHVFEETNCKPHRMRFLGQLRPLLKRAGIDWEKLGFVGMDLTPPDAGRGDGDKVQGWVDAGIITVEEARAILELPARTRKSAAPASRVERLLALLESL